jgi:CO/xanthine dehydrogenase Mo-binding subunit
VAGAIANAVRDAVGVRMQRLPITAERVYAALEEQRARDTAKS